MGVQDSWLPESEAECYCWTSNCSAQGSAKYFCVCPELPGSYGASLTQATSSLSQCDLPFLPSQRPLPTFPSTLALQGTQRSTSWATVPWKSRGHREATLICLCVFKGAPMRGNQILCFTLYKCNCDSASPYSAATKAGGQFIFSTINLKYISFFSPDNKAILTVKKGFLFLVHLNWEF